MTAIIVAAIWAIASNLVAMLPHNALHWNLARILVLLCPVVLWLVGRDFGILAMIAFVIVIVSLFRLPLMHLVKYLTGQLEEKE